MPHAELARALGEPPAEARAAVGWRRPPRDVVADRGRAGRSSSAAIPEGPDRDVVRLREWRVLQLARDAGVPVPDPLALTPERIVVERVAG